MKNKIKYWLIRIFKGKDKAFDFATDMQMKSIKRNDSDIEKYYEDNVTILDCGSIVNKHEHKERGY
tara:strand:- start:1069 stop:1266 length:198 start_codon:yes stop_codon:yes gene_type:complete